MAIVLGVPLGVLLGIVVGLPGLLIGAGIGVWVASKAFHLVGTWPYVLVLVATMFAVILIGFPIMAVAISSTEPLSRRAAAGPSPNRRC